MISAVRSEEPAAPPRHQILNTAAPEAAVAWDDLLTLQVDLSFEQELSYLIECRAFPPACSVLDAGCGNGAYIARLAPFFPATAWTGIDSSREMIEVAEQRFNAPQLRFLVEDFFAFGPTTKFDTILMRLLVQHLTDFGALLNQAWRCLAPSGALFLIEPDLEETRTAPRLPIFESMIREYETAATQSGRLRTRIADIPSLVEQSPAWRLTDDRHLVVPRAGPFADNDVVRMYLRWIELCERSGSFRFPFMRARNELEQWAAYSGAFARFGVRIFRLEKA